MYTMITQILKWTKEEIGKLCLNFFWNRENFGMENFKMIAVRFASGGKGVIGSTLDKDGKALGLKRKDNLEMQTKNNQLSIQTGALNSCLY